MEVELKWPKIPWKFFGFQKKILALTSNHFLTESWILSKTLHGLFMIVFVKPSRSQGGSPDCFDSHSEKSGVSFKSGLTCESWFEVGSQFIIRADRTLRGTPPVTRGTLAPPISELREAIGISFRIPSGNYLKNRRKLFLWFFFSWYFWWF